jgi:VIT1/CCC1 family predicted Fe2+/Mn2+ transporter
MLMDKGTRTGIFFGATSGVITTVGLMVGLQSGTQSVTAVFGGVAVIAVSDSLSDALGIHLAQEADPESTRAHIWAATLWAFVSKFLVAISFVVPLLLLPLDQAVQAGVIWGLMVVTAMSYFLARMQHTSAWRAVGEHVSIALVVIVLSHYVGVLVHSMSV